MEAGGVVQLVDEILQGMNKGGNEEESPLALCIYQILNSDLFILPATL